MATRRYGPSGWACTYPIIDQESGWDATIHNGGGHGYVPGLSYGIPQAKPGSKMASAGARWLTDARTQIHWYFDYVDGRYGGPCGALAHKRATGWY